MIDELMGHEGSGSPNDTSVMGRLYRRTTPEMLARVTDALDERLGAAEAAAVKHEPAMEAKRRARLSRRRRSRKPRKRPFEGSGTAG